MGTFMNFDFWIFVQRQTPNFILCTKCYGVIGLVYVVKRVEYMWKYVKNTVFMEVKAAALGRGNRNGH